MDFPASGQALWTIYDRTGIRPEWLVPVLASESGLNPAIPNRAGAPYYGINQISGTWLANAGIDVSDYLTWPASRQLEVVVLPYMAAQVQAFGALQSGIRVYQANFYPASLKYAPGLGDVIVSSPSPAYTANMGLDVGRKGYITPGDLGAFVGKAAAHTYVQNVIAATYALRPSERETDPVYGLDFGRARSWGPIVLGGGIAAAGVALAWWVHQGMPVPRLLRA